MEGGRECGGGREGCEGVINPQLLLPYGPTAVVL